jgi:hypothetical protein
MNAVVKQEAEKAINWFDLSRFGVALRVLPHSPLRGSALTVLEIRDNDLYQRAVGWHEGISHEERSALREGLHEAMQDLGFSLQASYVNDPHDAGRSFIRFYSSRQSWSLREIKRVVPGAEVTDLRPMPVNEVAIRHDLQPEVGVTWERFIDTTLKQEAVGVWVPKQYPYDTPWADAVSIEDLKPKGARLNRCFNRIESGFLPDHLGKAGYRSNALIGFYATMEAAVADGLAASDLEQVDLPYAAPLWVTRGNQVVAIKDVRFCPEIMAELPELLYGDSPKGGLVVPALRAVAALQPWLESRVGDWHAMLADETQRPDVDTLWQSINEAIGKLATVSYSHAKLHAVSSSIMLTFNDENGPFEALPLAKMDATYARELTYTIQRFTNLSEDAATVLRQTLTGLIEYGHGLLAEQLVDAARQSIRDAADQVRDGDPVINADVSARARIDDVGEKIGGARKDFAKRAMTVDDLEFMTDGERKALVNKASVWPPLDYAAMRDSGVTAHAAMAIKVLKDTLATGPDKKWKGDVDALYIQAIGLVRDHMAEVKTLSDFSQALVALYDAGLDKPNEPFSRKVYSTPIQFQWGRRGASMINDGSGNHYGAGLLLPQAVNRATRKYVGPKELEASGGGSWGYLIKSGKSLTPEEKAQREAKAKQHEELHRPHLEKVVREGHDWRHGRDVGAEDLMTQFGFRGVEFGNWLPQDERQQVVNMAFDSFMDLAQALDLPPKALSFDGKLAVAFGARGTGGMGAAHAHFETNRNVINLTRIKGAGLVAHEWYHGLDWNLGDGQRFASEMDRSGTAMLALSRGLSRTGMTMAELDAKTSVNLDRSMDNIAGWASSPKAPRESLAALVRIEAEALREKFYDSARTVVEVHRNDPDFVRDGLNPARHGYGAIDPGMVREQIDSVMGRLKDRHPEQKVFAKYSKQIRGNVTFLVANMAASATIDALRDLNLPMPGGFSAANARETKFLQDAKKLDKERGSPYWATTREMFARAGAAYVNDRLEGLDVRSDYLVYGADEARHLTNDLGNPNPAGEDRQRFAGFFTDLMAEYRMRVVAEPDRPVSISSDDMEP